MSAPTEGGVSEGRDTLGTLGRPALDTYRLLGRSGLRVSPLSLGGMTLGDDWGWGADEQESARMVDLYLDRGGNFIDTANVYTDGSSESLLGRCLTGRRDRVVLATKYAGSTDPTNPNASGNHRRNMVRSVEDSLRRLQTDYIDVYYLHAWDGTTSVEEVVRGLDDLVRSGKVVYVAVSDVPAWQIARMQTIVDLRGWSPLVAVQIEYSLAQRTGERDLIPMAAELGLGVVPWSPLAHGVLTGKYGPQDLREATEQEPSGRLAVAAANGVLTQQNLDISDVVGDVAHEIGCSRAQVALAWTLTDPAVTSTIVGARTVDQLSDNLAALDVELSSDHLTRLDQVSAVPLGFPHDHLRNPMTRRVLMGDTRVTPRS